jgi:hypothetical protein
MLHDEVIGTWELASYTAQVYGGGAAGTGPSIRGAFVLSSKTRSQRAASPAILEQVTPQHPDSMDGATLISYNHSGGNYDTGSGVHSPT